MFSRKKEQDNSISSNMFYALFSQLISLSTSILTSLILPKFIGVEEYGYYQLFIFYSTYVGFALFGLNDGIYLRFGGNKYENLDKELLKIQFIYSLLIQAIVISVGIVTIYIQDNSAERRYIFIFTAVYMLVSNTYGFIAYIFQAVNLIKLYSWSIMIERFFFALFLVLSILLQIDNFYIYVTIVVVAKLIAMIYCLLYSKDIMLQEVHRWRDGFREMLLNMSVGMNLMLANIASMLILGIVRFLIDRTWGIEAFAKFSFSLSLANFFLMFINQVSMVLFPALKRVTMENQKQIFNRINELLYVIMPIIYLVYFPMSIFVKVWLPQYSESVVYLAFILPICIFDGKMNLLYSTYYKMLRKEKQLLCINFITVCVSSALALVGIYIFDNIIFVIIGMVVAIIFRSIVSYLILSNTISDLKNSYSILVEIALATIFIYLNVKEIYFGAFVGILCIELFIVYRHRSFVLSQLKKR